MDTATQKNKNKIVNISSFLQQHAGTQPFKRAVVYPEGRDTNDRLAYTQLTFRQLDQESDCMASGLGDVGVTHCTRVVLVVKPGLVFFSLIYALFKQGAIPILVDPAMGLKGILECLKLAKPDVFIGLPQIHLLRIIFPGYFKTVKTHITIGQRLFLKSFSLNQLLKVPWKRHVIPEPYEDDAALLIYTKDSKGQTKGAAYSYGNLVSQAREITSHFNITEHDINLSTIPLFSILYPALGVTAIVPVIDKAGKKSSDSWENIETLIDQGVTSLVLAPAHLHQTAQYIKENKISVSSLKRVISVGEPLNPSQIEHIASHLSEDAEVHALYCTGDAAPITWIDNKEIHEDTKELSEKGFGNCIGRPVVKNNVNLIKITDDPIEQWSEDLVVSRGDTGEIVVKLGLVSDNECSIPEQNTLDKIHEADNVWLRTGDLGWMDKGDRIWYCGKKHQRIITQNATLFTIPCETIFNTHKSVSQSTIVGVGPIGGKKPVICVELEKENMLSKEEIEEELLALAKKYIITKHIDTVLFPISMPMHNEHSLDPVREKLTAWAEKQLK